MQKFRKAKIIVSIIAIASLLITTIAPVASAASSFNTEGQVKSALYAAAAYECVNNGMLQNTAVGNKRESILIGAETQKVFIGHWLGDSDGMITCKEALTKTLGGGNITENMLKSGQVFNGVYTQSASGEQQIQCNYGIVNSTGNSTLDGTYSWPQGYIKDANGNLVDKRSHGVIQVVFNENGPIRLVGATSDIDTTHTLESMRNWSIDWSQPSKICHNLVMYTEVYPIGQVQNAMGETISVYAEVLATDDPTPFNEWGIHVDDRNRAWLYYSEANSQTKKFTHTLTSVSSSTSLELTSNAKTKLLSNISTLYLNGKTDVASFLDSSADAKYILYGRYLFNGDGAGSFACGGISVATDDPNFSELSATDYWDTSQPYVASVQAYKDSTATSKTTFRTKFGGDGFTSPGAAKSIYFPGVSGDCKALAGTFNGINPTSTSAKAAVKNFMKVGSVEELPDTNTPGSTDPDDPSEGEAGLMDGCFNNAGVLGWILCPVLKIAGAATEGIYDMIVENYLSMDSTTMTSAGLRDAWGKFQGYANILFAILLIIVILSQVTGIGLSNYGIKKVLPRLIITIVLVNLSYILCLIAVDLSNIIGVSLNDLLGNIDVGGYVASNINIGTMVINSIEGIGATGLALVAGGALFPVLAESWPNLILVLFLAVISILISILFFFILLAVRQAMIIILVAIAPLAVVCYALPNTQKMFDRWLKMFSSLLMVFPICGAMMGGCNLASRLLLDAGGENGLLYYIIVMVLGVVPLFFIPSVLKTSMSALGSVGRTLATAGDRFSRWTNRTITGTQAFKDRQQEAARTVNMNRNKRIMDKTKLSETEQARLGSLRAKRASGAVLSNSERKELRELGSRQYRYARAASARERGVMEDAMSDVASRREMLEHGSARYEKIVAGAMREQRNRDDAGQIAMYEEGKVKAYDGSGDTVIADDLNSLSREHMSLLERVAAHPEDEAAASKLRAVQTLMGKMGTNGFDRIENNFGKLMHDNAGFTARTAEQRRGIRDASANLTRNFAGQIKAGSRTLDSMLKDINADNFSNMSSFSQETFDDYNGGTVSRYVSSNYSHKGAQSIKAENVNDLGDAYYDNLLRATITGDLSGQDLEQVLNVFNEAKAAAAAGKITLKGEVRQRIDAIENVAYASGHVPHGHTRSEGSRMIGTASAAGIDNIVKQIENAGNWGTMTTAQKQQYSDLVNNITDSLKQDAHTVDNVRQLQSALASARAKGIETAVSGGSLVDQVGSADLHQFKVPRGAKQKVAMPTGWTLTASGNWIDVATGRPLSAADAMKAKQIMEHNNSIDIENNAS